jgi:hypothetical protein
MNVAAMDPQGAPPPLMLDSAQWQVHVICLTMYVTTETGPVKLVCG